VNFNKNVIITIVKKINLVSNWR